MGSKTTESKTMTIEEFLKEQEDIHDVQAKVMEWVATDDLYQIEDVIAQDLIENICAYYTAYIKPGYFDEKIAIAQFINDFDI